MKIAARALAGVGDFLATHRRLVFAGQWLVVFFYALLVVLPAFFPLPHPDTRLLSEGFGNAPSETWQLGRDRLVLLAQYIFWGVWWPGVILSMILVGRLWCGVLCPEGTLSEIASRHGRGGSIPRWLRWPVWPLLGFVATTAYGQMISVYDYAAAALLILGGSTVLAMGIGYFYGKGKRVWCRYLCPVSGVFSLLARLAPMYYQVNPVVWMAQPRRTHAVDCAPLLNVRQLNGMAQCHACGRCSGHRNAVRLAWRSPHSELLYGKAPTRVEALLLLFGMLGLAMGAFQWSVNPWFIQMKQFVATWLIANDNLWLLSESPAWWLLTRYPEAQDVFTLLDGIALLFWMFASAGLVGALTSVSSGVAGRLAGVAWQRLALSFLPIAAIGLFLGLSMMSVNHLRAEGISLGWVPAVRALLLGGALLWSAFLSFRLCLLGTAHVLRRLVAALVLCLPLALIGANWGMIFFHW